MYVAETNMSTHFTPVLCKHVYIQTYGWMGVCGHPYKKTHYSCIITYIHTYIHACMHTYIHSCYTTFFSTLEMSRRYFAKKIEFTRRGEGRGNLADMGNAGVVRNEVLLLRHGTFAHQSHPCTEWTGHLSIPPIKFMRPNIRFDNSNSNLYAYTFFSLAHGTNTNTTTNTNTSTNTRRRNHDIMSCGMFQCAEAKKEVYYYTFNGVYHNMYSCYGFARQKPNDK